MGYILITGSSRGLGLEIAKELSYKNYQIILVSNNTENLKKAYKQLNPKIEHLALKIDLTKTNSCKKLIKKIASLPIDSIIHNFGMKLDKDSHDINIDILKKTIEINFFRSIEINNSLADKLTGNPSKIIYIGSTASLHAKASPCYTLSKSLINTYVKNISQYYLTKNISICALLPGIIAHKDSEWDKKQYTNIKKYEETKKRQPLGRFPLPEDIAPYITDLIKQKSVMHTGSIIKLDVNEY